MTFSDLQFRISFYCWESLSVQRTRDLLFVLQQYCH